MFSRCLFVFAALALAGCKNPLDIPDDLGDLELGPATVLTVVSGGNQTVTLNSDFGQPVRVRLVTATGQPMPGQIVDFAFFETIPNLVSGGGLFTHRTTDADGIAEIKFTATRVGPFEVRASFQECKKVGVGSFLLSCVETVTRTQVSVTGNIVAAGP